MQCRFLRALCLVVALVHGCSGITPYRSTGEKNVQIRTSTEGARASVDVYRVDSSCRAQYEGTIALDSSRVDAGIPTDARRLLVFRFTSSSWLGSSKSTMSRETLFKPQPGRRYQIDLSYRNDIYNVAVREKDAGGRAARELDLKGLDTCR